MFAVKIREQDGYKIVESFRTLSIDALATRTIRDKKCWNQMNINISLH